VETLFHGLDSTSLVTSSDGVRDELGIPAEAPLVGMVANFRAQKRHDVLLYAALVVRDAVPDARFVLVGQGPLEEDMRRLAAELDLNGTVLFTGFRDDATRLAAAFDVFALPSAWEGLPIALLEAMWLGKPCVVSRVGGTSEVVEHETNALVVPPGDSYALATELIRVLKDRPLQERLGAGATTRARQFEIHHAVDRMEQVYQELLR
jgi:glycosyltransferase involved in cell wall biosynthesis